MGYSNSMAAVFRGMFEEAGTGRPALSVTPGEKPLLLGVPVVPHDAVMPTGENADLWAQPDGTVRPGRGGMSVSPSWKTMPFFTVPARLRGVSPFRAASGDPGPDSFIWSHSVEAIPTAGATGPFARDLTLRMNSKRHGMIEPAATVNHTIYRDAIQATRPAWQIDEPTGPANNAEPRPG